MAKTTFASWRDEVAKYVKYQSTYQSDVEAEIKEVLRDFCRDTGVWKQTIADFSTVKDESTYTLSVSQDDGAAEICYIDHVLYKENGADDTQFRPLTPFTQEEADLYENGAWAYHESTDPYKFHSNLAKQLILYPIPTIASTNGVSVRVVIRPKDSASDIQTDIFAEYKQAIAIGTAASLMNMPNKPWSNAEMGTFYKMQYKARKDEAYLNVKQGYTKAKKQVSIPWCGGSRSQRRAY